MIQISYWTSTGNTGNMAKYIAEGLTNENKEVTIKEMSETNIDELLTAELIILGASSQGSEELDEDEVAPFIESLEGKIEGKKIALFGSYGWGGGIWMETWAEQMKGYGAILVEEPLICNEFIEGQDEEICTEYGSKLAKL